MEQEGVLDYVFDLSGEWLKHLHEEGYVVIRGVADDAEVEKARSEFWACIERFL
jgi:hypothetical protein